jgi:hypothetical protein
MDLVVFRSNVNEVLVNMVIVSGGKMLVVFLIEIGFLKIRY